jgi:hypothetical protein
MLTDDDMAKIGGVPEPSGEEARADFLAQELLSGCLISIV